MGGLSPLILTATLSFMEIATFFHKNTINLLNTAPFHSCKALQRCIDKIATKTQITEIIMFLNTFGFLPYNMWERNANVNGFSRSSWYQVVTFP